MRVLPTDLPGAFVIEPDLIPDVRGFFARVFCVDELDMHGLETNVLQESISFSSKAGTLRGMHWQQSPHEEAKYVRCTGGVIHDVIVDLRPTSPTHLRWTAFELSAANRRTLYIPRGFAHGFLTLTDDTEVHYAMTTRFAPQAARGARYDDPTFGIAWPTQQPAVISDKDLGYPTYRPEVRNA